MRRNDWLLGQLPMGMMDDDFFVRFVSIFQEVATSTLEGADNIENIVDVTVAPESMVRYLGSILSAIADTCSGASRTGSARTSDGSSVLAW